MELLDPKPAPPKKKPNLFFRFLAFLMTLLLLLGAVLLVANRDKLNLDGVRRWFSYHTLKRGDSGQAESFTYDGGSSSSFATLGDGLLVCSNSAIRLYSGSGTLYIDQTVSTMEHPVISHNAKTALVFDSGGQDLFVFSGTEQVFSLSLKAGESILSARLNDAGWMAVTAQESGYKGTVTIYNASYESVLRIKLSSRFISDAIVSPDCKSMVLITLGIDGSQFNSRAEFFTLARSEDAVEPDAFASLGNDMPLDLRWKADGVWVLGENAVFLVAPDATITAAYHYTGRYLKGFSLEGDGYVALLLGKYRAGSSADLVVVDATGTVTATKTLNNQIFSLSASGKYISLLSSDRLDIYMPDLSLYNTLETVQGARRVIQRSDGSAMLMSADTAHLYIPN